MQIHFGLGSLRAEWAGAVVCVGTFDGVHLGHRSVIGTAVARARETESPCLLVTFDRHPAGVLAPPNRPAPIAGLEENLRFIRELGVGLTVVMAFDAALSRTPAMVFLDEILRGALRAERLVIGHDFALGNGREGDADWLSARIPTDVVPPLELDGERVSSTRVRAAISSGDMDGATRLLGRPFALRGLVVTGKRLGRTIGFPTANLARSLPGVEPPNGVYAGWAQTVHGRFRAAVNVGVRPTVGGEGRTFEPYLLDYPGESLYGTEIRLEFHRRLRDERKFGSLDELKNQLARDVSQTASLPA